ncbi:MAG: TonB-dependent receptor, partial [Alphaproteobacteria bacterium]
SFSGDRIDWRVALDYEIVDDVRLYGQVSTGFKGGRVNPRPYLESQAVPYDQETATSYEAGFKSMLFDRKLRVNGAYYHTDYKNYQGLVSSCPDISPPGFTFCSATRNVGDAKIDGFELEVEAQPVDGMSLDASVSYTDFRFVTGLAGSGIVPGVTDAPFVPKWKYAIGAQYAIPLGNAGSLTPRVDWTWQSEMQSNIPNNITGFLSGEVEERGLLNARLTYRSVDEDWEVSLAATNLTDKFYYVNKYDRVSQSGNAYGLPGRPREFQVSVKRKF